MEKENKNLGVQSGESQATSELSADSPHAAPQSSPFSPVFEQTLADMSIAAHVGMICSWLRDDVLRSENLWMAQRAIRIHAKAVEEKAKEIETVAGTARDFVWEPENWEAYQDSKDSNSVAWPPEFLLMAQAVEKKYGPMPVDED